MPSILCVLATAILCIAVPCISMAVPLKTYVSEFSVAGAPDRDELKVTLQALLASRLNPDQTQLVESAARAELLLTGSYAHFGKIFSLDILIKQTTKDTLTKVFEQGEGQDDLIPAMGRLARKVERELVRIQPAAAQPASPAAIPASAAPAAATKGYVIKSDNSTAHSAISALEGVFTSIALGRTLPAGERELFVAGERSIRFFRSGAGLTQVAAVTLPIPARILAIDTADLDRDGLAELYVTILDRETLVSRVYRATDSGLELLADKLPWFFRGSGLELKNRVIYAQGMSNDGEYYGGVAELVKTGNRFETRNSRTLPPQANIFNATRFRDASGAELLAILDEDGYLIVSTGNGTELWKSSDKYGGSETNFKHQSIEQMRTTGDQNRWTFIEQRITLLPDGTLLVPHNQGTFSIGNSRSFNKHTLHALKWTGALLKEAWHTRQTPSYLADYAYDPAAREVMLLEVVQRAGLFGTGKTAISINGID